MLEFEKGNTKKEGHSEANDLKVMKSNQDAKAMKGDEEYKVQDDQSTLITDNEEEIDEKYIHGLREELDEEKIFSHVLKISEDESPTIGDVINQDRKIFMFSLQVDTKKQVKTNTRCPVDLVCVVDVSGSMKGLKFEQLKKAVHSLTNLLEDADRMSIVTFSESATRKFSLKRMNEKNKALLQAVMSGLKTETRTNIYSGIEEALNILNERKWKNPVPRIFLLSDGEDNCNEHLMEDLEKLTRKQDMDFMIDTFAFGTDHHSSVMEKIADLKGGSYYHVGDLEALSKWYACAFGKIEKVLGFQVEIRIEIVETEIFPRVRIVNDLASSYPENKSSKSAGGSEASKLTKYTFEENQIFDKARCILELTGFDSERWPENPEEVEIVKVVAKLFLPVLNKYWKKEYRLKVGVQGKKLSAQYDNEVMSNYYRMIFAGKLGEIIRKFIGDTEKWKEFVLWKQKYDGKKKPDGKDEDKWVEEPIEREKQLNEWKDKFKGAASMFLSFKKILESSRVKNEDMIRGIIKDIDILLPILTVDNFEPIKIISLYKSHKKEEPSSMTDCSETYYANDWQKKLMDDEQAKLDLVKIKKILEALLQKPSEVTYIKLDEQCGDTGAKELSKIDFSNLRTLELNNQRISSIGAKALGSSSGWQNLRILNLNDNFLGNPGARVLGQNNSWKNLEKLKLAINSITDEGLFDLTENITWHKLKVIHLENNPVTDKGVDRLKKRWPALQVHRMPVGA